MEYREYRGKYIVYENGTVWSNVKNDWLKISKNSGGYYQLTVGKEHWKLHRLLATLFIPNPDKKPQVNHINGIRDDNRLENLEWVTNSENQKHAYANGKKTTGAFVKDFYGESHHSSKLKKEDVVEIRNSKLTITELSDKFGVSKQNIRNILRNKIWKEQYL